MCRTVRPQLPAGHQNSGGTILAVLALCVWGFVWTPAVAAGQGAGGPPATVGPCGPLDDSERMFLLEHYDPLFTSDDEDPTASRADFELERVSSGEPRHVVERRGDCALVVAAAFRILNDEILSGRPVTRSSENWAVLRFGPYYLVPIYARPSERIVVHQYGQVLIFAVEDLRFLTWFLG